MKLVFPVSAFTSLSRVSYRLRNSAKTMTSLKRQSCIYGVSSGT